MRRKHSGATGAPPVRIAVFPQGRSMLSEPHRGEFMLRAEGRAKAGRARSVVDGVNAGLLINIETEIPGTKY